MIESQGGFLIGKIKQIQARVFEKLLIQHGVRDFNGAQGRILFVLWENDNIPISDLSKQTGLAKTTLTSMIDRLEASNHLQRIYDSTDRRKINIKLTDNARKMKNEFTTVSYKMTELFYEGFNREEIILFENLLLRILSNLEKKEHSK